MDDTRRLTDREKLMERVKNILNQPTKQTGVLRFNPLSFKDIHGMIGGKKKNVNQKDNVEKDITSEKERMKKTIDDIDSEYNRDNRINDMMMEQSSLYIPDVDVGTNVLFTYFLHAIEIERLVTINIDLVKEGNDMEIELNQVYDELEKKDNQLITMMKERDDIRSKYRQQLSYNNSKVVDRDLKNNVPSIISYNNNILYDDSMRHTIDSNIYKPMLSTHNSII